MRYLAFIGSMARTAQGSMAIHACAIYIYIQRLRLCARQCNSCLLIISASIRQESEEREAASRWLMPIVRYRYHALPILSPRAILAICALCRVALYYTRVACAREGGAVVVVVYLSMYTIHKLQ